MKPGVPTVIHCQVADGSTWQARGRTREEAEDYYMAAICEELARPPVCRFVVQLRIDQHDGFPSLAIH